jgi:hypothetical protein
MAVPVSDYRVFRLSKQRPHQVPLIFFQMGRFEARLETTVSDRPGVREWQGRFTVSALGWREREDWLYLLSRARVLIWSDHRQGLLHAQVETVVPNRNGISAFFRSIGDPVPVPWRLVPRLPEILIFEADGQSLPIYHDWCLDNDWPERAEDLAKQLERT